MPMKPETVMRKVDLLPEYHRRLFLEFKEWSMKNNGTKENTACANLRVLMMFSNHIGLEKRIDKATEQDILQFLDKRKKGEDEDPDQRWITTWNDYLARLIGFYRWMHNRNVPKVEEWVTPEPICLIRRKKDRRMSAYAANDVWTVDELLTVVRHCGSLRDKVVLTLMWDMAARNHEITKVRLRDIRFYEKYAEITTSWDTKTGQRTCPLIVSFPYVRDWINEHPFSNDQMSFLVLAKVANKPIKPDRLWGITNELKKRMASMLENAEIRDPDRSVLAGLLKKPWNPYLLGRHSSITEKTDMLTDHQLIKYAGWTPNTKRRATYIHMSGRQVCDPLLVYNGIKEPAKPTATRQDCPKCDHVNKVESSVCVKCGFVLSANAWQQEKAEEQEQKQRMEDRMQSLEEQTASTNMLLEKLLCMLPDDVDPKKILKIK